jgi:hypothetical protein
MFRPAFRTVLTAVAVANATALAEKAALAADLALLYPNASAGFSIIERRARTQLARIESPSSVESRVPELCLVG